MKRLITGLSMLMIIVLVSGCYSSTPVTKGKVITNSAEVTSPALETVVSGRVEGRQSAKVVSKVLGKVAAVYVDIGSQVKQGEVLLRLDGRDTAASVKMARASLDSARLASEYAKKNYQRATEMYNSGALSNADYENNFVNVMEKSQIAVQVAEASLDKAMVADEDMNVRAPFTGTITSCNTSPGEMVNPQIPVITLVKLDQLLIKASVDERHINLFTPGQTVRVTISSLPGKNLLGQVAHVAAAPDSGSKNYTMKVYLANPDGLIKVGMLAQIYLENQGSSSEKGVQHEK